MNYPAEPGLQILWSVMAMFTYLALLAEPVTGSIRSGMIFQEMAGKEKPSLCMGMMFMLLAGLMVDHVTGRMM